MAAVSNGRWIALGRATSTLSLIATVILLLAIHTAEAGTKVALVIGNSRYSEVPKLPNPENDARAVARSLERLGFSVTQVIDADFERFRKAVLQFGRDANGAQIAVVFFAGHGLEVGGENWLIPVDATVKVETDIEKEAIDLRSIILALSNTQRLGLVILDACRNNPFAATMQRVDRLRAVARGLARVEVQPRTNILVAYAAKDGTTSEDGAGDHSPFTSALLDNIETPGLEINFLFRHVRDEVVTATHGAQQPFVYGSLSREKIYLKTPASSELNPADSTANVPAPDLRPGSPQLVTDCDRLAAATSDTMRPPGVQGVALDNIKVDLARPACESAVRDNPKVTRFVFEAGRVALAEKNFKKARAFYERASYRDYAPAMEALGRLWALGRFGTRDYRVARYWFEKAVALGNTAAQSDLGYLYEMGLGGVTPDFSKAHRLYKKAAEEGDSMGMNNLGWLYESGRDVPCDYEEARRWYEKSAALNNPVAMRNLGELYALGRGVKQNVDEARRWYVMAASKGDEQAKKKLEELSGTH
jgi:hypothetical protein